VQVVILAGGLGTRLSEETDVIPKPMVRIGNIPILHHIMNYYAGYGHTDFVIALGYKAEIIKDYFADLNEINWNISLVDTGLETATGGRIKRLESILDEEFMLTYGDGLSNIDLVKLKDHHKKHNKIATVSAVRPPARFGTIQVKDGIVTKFAEKDPQDQGWINGGFFCLNKKICSFIKDSQTSLESDPMNGLVAIRELTAYEHQGWWHPMDTLRDKRALESIWESGEVPWSNL
jgi:glucose-1-phosphate cytidylyltransferase